MYLFYLFIYFCEQIFQGVLKLDLLNLNLMQQSLNTLDPCRWKFNLAKNVSVDP